MSAAEVILPPIPRERVADMVTMAIRSDRLAIQKMLLAHFCDHVYRDCCSCERAAKDFVKKIEAMPCE